MSHTAATTAGDAAGLLGGSPTFISLLAAMALVVPMLMLYAPARGSPTDALRRTHTKLGVPPRDSSLHNQTSAEHYPRAGRAARIQSLLVYPVKSCRGIEVKSSKILPKGLEFDRLYTFARPRLRDGEWEIATLRQLPLLANVQVDLWLPDEMRLGRLLAGKPEREEGGWIVVRFPRKGAGLLRRLGWGASENEFLLPVEFPSQKVVDEKGYRHEDVHVFTRTVRALNMGSEVPPEFAEYLGARGPLSLFRSDPSMRRELMRNAPRKDVIGYQPVVDFQDQYPVHLLNLTSARALESKIQKDENLEFLDARRFRPNIIVSGLPEYDEDDWRCIQAKPAHGHGKDAVTFDVSCHTVRCKLPNVDPATGIRHKAEPDHALRNYREIDQGAPGKGCFGMQMCPLFGETEGRRHLEGFLEVGMEIDVLQRGPHFAL